MRVSLRFTAALCALLVSQTAEAFMAPAISGLRSPARRAVIASLLPALPCVAHCFL
jgi:hypothetical protein